MNAKQHIASITLDEASITRRTSELEHERTQAINDLIDWNHFVIPDAEGPYHITLGTAESRIALTVRSETLKKPVIIPIALAPLRSVVRDYFLICESYFEAVKSGNLPKIEAIDMSRRGIHNEGSEILTTLLDGKVNMDSETARRLFTLICVLHMK